MEYAQARMQARHGASPAEAQWHLLGGQDSLAAYLAAARTTALARWLGDIPGRADSQRIELAMRQRWRETVAELARWMPAEWRAAVCCCADLVDLPAHAWLARGAPPLPWMARDPVLSVKVAAPAATRQGDRSAWLQGWRARWPALTDEDREALNGLVKTLETHLAGCVQRAGEGAGEARRALAREAVHRFRRVAGRPPAAFFYLLLVALELERLRAELVLRALFAEDLG